MNFPPEEPKSTSAPSTKSYHLESQPPGIINTTTTNPNPPNATAPREMSTAELAARPSLAMTSFFVGVTLFTVFVFFFQFFYFRSRGSIPLLPPWLYAIAAPGTTILMLKNSVQMAPLRWPGLRRGWLARRATVAICALWVGWSWGVWMDVRTW